MTRRRGVGEVRPLKLVALSICAAAGLGACAGEQKAKKPATSNTLRETALSTLRDEADRQRQQMIAAELNRYAEENLVYSAAKLPPGQRKLLAKLLEAADVVEELNLLQAHPKMLEFRDQVQKTGTAEDKRLFHRNHGPWCLDNNDVRCTALRMAPTREVGMHAWPKGFLATELLKIRSAQNKRELTSPFTLVRKANGYVAAPLVLDAVLGDRVKKLSNLLKEAAGLAENPTAAAFLKERAAALLSPDAFPYDDSDLKWISLGGDWEITVGPYETYRNPFRIKARFAMYIGRQDPVATEELSGYRRDLQWMENRLSSLVGRRVYRPRKINDQTAIRAVHVIRAAGDARRSRGAVVAYHLPNVGKGPEQGLTKKVILINHLRAMHPVMMGRSRLVLNPEQVELVKAEAAIDNISFHEFCHGFGAYPTMKIKVGDNETTIAEALGPYNLLMEELKAETLSLWLVEKLRRKGRLNRLAQKERYTTAVVRLAGLLQMDIARTHPKTAAIVLGALIKGKAVAFDGTKGVLSLDFRRFPRVLKTLAKRVATVQFKGDRAAAEKLLSEAMIKHGAGHTLMDNLELIRARGSAAFAKAGIRPLTFTYRVSGLVVTPEEAAAVAKPETSPEPKADAKKADAKKADAKKAGAKKADAKKADAKKAGAKKADAKKADAKKSDSKKSDAKKAK